MQVIIERNELAKAMGHVTSVVERRATMPILSCVLLDASGSSLFVKTTDVDREVTEMVKAKVDKPGAIAVPAILLNDIVRKLRAGSEIEITHDVARDRVNVRSGSSKFALPSISAADFPVARSNTEGYEFDVDAPDLKILIEKTRFAISTEESRYYLNGIYLHTAERNGHPTLRAVATDGHRLAQFDVDLPSCAEGMPGVIVPRKTVHELHRLIESTEGAIHVHVSDSHIRFAVDQITMTSKLIDGSFPDYQRVVPQSNDKMVQTSNDDFKNAVDRVSTIADKSRPIKICASTDGLGLSMTSPDGGLADDHIGAVYDGENIDVGFNAKYLLDLTSQIDGDNIVFKFSDPASPAIVLDSGNDRALYVLMPMRA